MTANFALNPPILELLSPECTAGLFGLGRSQIKVPEFNAEQAMLRGFDSPDGVRQYVAIETRPAGGRITGGPYDLIVRMRRQLADFPLQFLSQHTDAAGHSWDLICEGTLKVVDPVRFAQTCSAFAGVGTPLRRDRLAHVLAMALAPAVKDALSEVLRESEAGDISENQELPGEWWTPRFTPELQRRGLALHDLRTRFESEDAQRAKQAKCEAESIARAAQAAEESNRLRIDQARRDAQLAAELDRIHAEEDERKLKLRQSSVAGEFQLDQLTAEYNRRRAEAHTRFQKEQLEGKALLQKMQQAMERGAIEHAIKMEQLREEAASARSEAACEREQHAEAAKQNATLRAAEINSKIIQLEEAARQAQSATAEQRELADLRLGKARAELEAAQNEARASAERARRAEADRKAAESDTRQAQQTVTLLLQQSSTITEAHEKQMAELDKLAKLFKDLLVKFRSELISDIFGTDHRKAYNAAAWMTSEGVSAQNLASLGIMTRLEFIEKLQPSSIDIKKHNLRRELASTRDIVAGAASEVALDTLRYDEAVDFDFTSRRTGFVTVINPGTSGKFSLQAPNAYRLEPRVEANRTYHVPGPELLPQECLQAAGLAYYEGGPEGWEYLVVIVSDEPLVDVSITDRATEKAPFVELTDEDLQDITDRLDRLGRDRWAAGVAKFRVVK